MLDFQFFATPGDLVAGWKSIKNIIDFKFVKEGYRDNPNWPIYNNLLDIPGLGVASSGKVRCGDVYIIMPSIHPLNIIKYKEDHNNTSAYYFNTEYFYSVLFMPDHRHFSCFELGGLWMENDVSNLIGYKLYYGDGDLNPTNEFLNQFKLFAKSLLHGFKTVKIKQFGKWKVGPEAYEMFRNGTRLVAYDASSRLKNNFGALDSNIYK